MRLTEWGGTDNGEEQSQIERPAGDVLEEASLGRSPKANRANQRRTKSVRRRSRHCYQLAAVSTTSGQDPSASTVGQRSRSTTIDSLFGSCVDRSGVRQVLIEATPAKSPTSRLLVFISLKII